MTSAPAGPALEGAELTHGIRAQAGAIEAVDIDHETFAPTCETIGGEAPIGICGSGVIDLLAGLFEAGVVDRRGQFRDGVRGHERLRTNDDGVLEYVLVTADDAGVDHDIVCTQNDIREIQMAKAAIQAGTLVLLEELDVETVERVVLAGGFGNYIDPESAMTIGLYPDVDEATVEFLGNAAGSGAQLALLNRAHREEADAIVDEVDYYEIAGTDLFRDHFMDAMYLPHREFERYPRVKARLEALRSVDDVPT
ncbi:MAG: ATP-binding protein [Halobacteriales archaeon]|nr:ATP-binding protein [Halobacteriales archaeon]